MYISISICDTVISVNGMFTYDKIALNAIDSMLVFISYVTKIILHSNNQLWNACNLAKLTVYKILVSSFSEKWHAAQKVSTV